jgi:hypothetical protein
LDSACDRAKRQGKKPATFDFLGFTHICVCSRKGKFTVKVRTMKKRLRRGLTAIADWCREHRHDPVEEQQQTLNAKLRGHYQYYGRLSFVVKIKSQSLRKTFSGRLAFVKKFAPAHAIANVPRVKPQCEIVVEATQHFYAGTRKRLCGVASCK